MNAGRKPPPRAAAYEVVNHRGEVLHRVQVGDARGYNGGQYGAGFHDAKRAAVAAANHTGHGVDVRFQKWNAAPSEHGIRQFTAAQPAAYRVVTPKGEVLSRIQVGDTRGYNGGQYKTGFEQAQRTAAGATRDGQRATVQFQPWNADATKPRRR